MKSWTLGAAPCGTFGHSSLFIGNDLYLIGGADEKGKLVNLIQILNFENESVESVDPKADLTARQFHSNIIRENKIYVFGGKSGSYRNDLIEIDISSKSVNAVSTSGTKPSPRFGHSGCIWNNKMFVYGGYDTDSSTTSQIFQLDLSTMTWSTVEAKGTMLPPSRYLCGSCVLGNYWYIFGGSSGVSPYNDMWSFEFETNTWREVKSHGKWPSPRWACTLAGLSASSNNNDNNEDSNVSGLYVFGGKTKTKVPEDNQLFRLDLSTGEWTQINLKETARYYHTCQVKNSQMIVAGGSTSTKNAIASVGCIDIPSITNIRTLSMMFKNIKINMVTRNHFDSLPFETFMEVLSHLDALDLIRASRVNRFWLKHTQNENLWRVLWETKYKNKDSTYMDGTRALPFSFIKNFKASDAQNKQDFNTVKAYNEWVFKYNAMIPKSQYYYVNSAPNTHNPKEINSNNNNSQQNSSDTYKALILMQLFFDSKEVDRKCDELEKRLEKDFSWIIYQPNRNVRPRPIGKMYCVGDGAVGKTCLMIRLSSNSFPEEYIPTVFDNYTVPLVWNRIPFSFCLWDTSGGEDYDRLRPLGYPGTTFFCVCFSVVNPSSFENAKARWVPEVSHFCPDTPKIVVATKVDLRTDPTALERLAAKKLSPITKQQGEAFAKEIGAIAYIETSALTGEGAFRVLEEGLNFTFSGKSSSDDHNKKCAIM